MNDTNTETAIDLDAKHLQELELRWLWLYGKSINGVPRGDFNRAERMALQVFARQAGKHALPIIEGAVENWHNDLAAVLKREADFNDVNRHPNIFTLADHYPIVFRWAVLRGFLPGVPIPQRKDHLRIGVPMQAQPYVNHTAKGIA